MKRISVVCALLAISCNNGRGLDSAAKPAAEQSLEASVSSALDPKISACDDFYAYACGGWAANTQIPADQVSWYRGFSTIDQRNEAMLKEILEQAAKGGSSDPDVTRVGNFFGACMDEKSIDAAGKTPVEPLLADLDKVTDLGGVMAATGTLGLVGASPFFGVYVDADFKNPAKSILYLGQGGLGLPDRDYYLEESAESEATREGYRNAMAKLLSLAGTADAEVLAKQIYGFELELAKIHKPRAELRDPEKTYHKIDRAGVESVAGGLPWARFLESSGIADRTDISVEDPEHLRALAELVGRTDVTVLRAYLRWHAVLGTASWLSSDFVNAHFAFFGQQLLGQKEMKVRWKRCVDATTGSFPEIVARYYVEKAFPGDSKTIALDMITAIEDSFQASLPQLAWMDDATRARAVEKMHAIQNKIGYPDRWRDYSSVVAQPGRHFENSLVARRFETSRQIQKVGRPADRSEWFMAASDVNAYYNPTFNEIAFPAGILQPPFFDRTYPPAMNFGGIGMVMGHELTHGFDDQGRKFDGQGVMTEWWAPEVAARFEERAGCVVNQYNNYEVLPGTKVNGELTLGENIADLGGLKQAFTAYRNWEAKNGKAKGVAGLTSDQLFFVAYAQSWCTLRTPEVEQMYATVDPHSPPKFRVNGAVTNFPAFAEAFQCSAGAPMSPAQRCEVW